MIKRLEMLIDSDFEDNQVFIKAIEHALLYNLPNEIEMNIIIAELTNKEKNDKT